MNMKPLLLFHFDESDLIIDGFSLSCFIDSYSPTYVLSIETSLRRTKKAEANALA